MAAQHKVAFIKIGTYDSKKLKIKPVARITSKKGNTTYNSFLEYDGCGKIYLELPPQTVYGINPTYPFDLPESQHNEDTMNGYQIRYSLSASMELSDAEAYIIKTLSDIQEKMWETAVKECDKENQDDIHVPGVSSSSYFTAIRGKTPNKSYMVKPIFSRPNVPLVEGAPKPKTRVKDETKPYCMYIKLNSYGMGKELKIYSNIYGPGNKKMHPSKYQDVKCTVWPVVQLNKLFWGAHGPNTHGVSLNITIHEMNVRPIQNENIRFLSPLEDCAEDESGDEESSSFANPKEEENDIFDSSSSILEDVELPKKVESISFSAEVVEEEEPIQEEPESKKKGKKSSSSSKRKH